MATAPKSRIETQTRQIGLNRMKIVITEAGGFVDSLIVPRLLEAGHVVVLIGRSPKTLAEQFAQVQVGSYDALPELGKQADCLLHLSTVKSNANVGKDTFFKVNVDQLVETAQMAALAGVKRFINVSTTHALDMRDCGDYSESKRAGIAALQDLSLTGMSVETVYMPAIYGDRWTGKLNKLNKLPQPLAQLLFPAIAALKPTCHVQKLVNFVENQTLSEIEQDIILTDPKDANLVYRCLARLIDLLFAVSVIILLGWLLFFVWIAIRLDSPGAGIFAQTRIGRHGKPFTCYKFRTMRDGTKQAGTHELTTSSITRLGRFLRISKIDELPQVINILRNDLSLIGPRPCLPSQNVLVEARHRLGVFEMKPGISGLAQINQIDMSDPERLAQWDFRYGKLRCLTLDLKIAMATLLGRGSGDRIGASTKL